MIRFLMVEPIESDSNLKFNMSIIYLLLIIFSMIDNIFIDNKTLLVTEIKSI
jgi:hypothetical protein